MLLQGNDKEEQPVEYASRLLTAAERNYSTTEREALAVVWAVQHFRGYIEGSEIRIGTDHQPLKWLMSLKSPSGRLARWALSLQPYNIKIEYTPGKFNVIADTLSRPPCEDSSESTCGVCSLTIELPRRSAQDIRKGQLEDPELQKIISDFEDPKSVGYANWTNRGYIMNNGVLYRYNPDEEEEDPQLVVPSQERLHILKEYHDSPIAGHYGGERTFQRIASRYFWTGMRKYILDYTKSCPDCQKYKVTNLKPAGLLQTPVMSQRFETISIDLFGPLPETKTGERWILIIEDTATKWVELFPLVQASADACARKLIDEIFLRYGVPRKMISDNGTQFVSSIMQKVTHCLGIKQALTSVYHPESNPVERKNRDLKTQLGILVGNDHTNWSEKIPSIRFAMNSVKNESTGKSPAYLTFGRELRTPDDVTKDLREIITSDTFVPQIQPYLLKLADTLKEVREVTEKRQDHSKKYGDQRRREAPEYEIGDLVIVQTHKPSNQKEGYTAKFRPRRDGPYQIIKRLSPSTYQLSLPKSCVPIGSYHTSALTPFVCRTSSLPAPTIPLRARGRPPKVPKSGSPTGRSGNPEGETVTRAYSTKTSSQQMSPRSTDARPENYT